MSKNNTGDLSDLGFTPETTNNENSTFVDPNPISKNESLLKGSQQGVTFGGADELQGINEVALDKGMAFLNRLSGGLVPKSPSQVNEELKKQGVTGDNLESDIKDIYTKKRDEARQDYKKAEDANPGSYLLGNIAGGVLVPGASMKGLSNVEKLKKLGQLGALSGAMTSEGDLTKPDSEELAKFVEDTGAGGALGVGLGAISNQVGSGVQKLTKGDGYLANLLNSYKLGKSGQNLVSETGRKELADEIIKQASPISKEITDEVGKLGKLKKELLETSQSKIDTTSLNDKLEEELGKKVTPFTEKGRLAQKALEEPFDTAKNLYYKSGKIEMSPKQLDEFRKVLGRLGFEQDLKDDEIISLAKRLSGQASDLLPNEIKGINKQLSPLLKAQEMLNVEGGNIVDDLGNTKQISSLIDRLEKEGLQGSLSRNQLEQVITSLQEKNPQISKKLSNSLEDLATKFDLAKKASRADFDVTRPFKSIPNLGLAGSNILGQAAKKAGLGGLTNNVLEATTKIAPVVNAGDIKNQTVQPNQKVEIKDLSKDQLKDITSEYANDPKYSDDVQQLNKALDENNLQARSAAIFKILQKNPQLRQKLRGEE